MTPTVLSCQYYALCVSGKHTYRNYCKVTRYNSLISLSTGMYMMHIIFPLLLILSGNNKSPCLFCCKHIGYHTFRLL